MKPKFQYFKNPIGEDGPNLILQHDWGKEIDMTGSIWPNPLDRSVKLYEFKYRESCNMHFHMKHEELVLVLRGDLLFNWIDTKTGHIEHVGVIAGDFITIPQGVPHKFIGAHEKGALFVEFATWDKNYFMEPEDDYFLVEKSDG